MIRELRTAKERRIMKLTWLTDIHLNFLEKNARELFYQTILKTDGDAVLITGDIAEANSVNDLLTEMVNAINKPIYFVLGNHDYYRGQVETVKATMVTLTQKQPQLIWMNTAGVLPLNENTLLVGQDGWADGRLGDYQNSRVQLNDSRMIADLMQANIFGKFKLLDKMQELADIDAAQLNKDLQLAVSKKPKKIIVLTHIPPFKEACMHQGKISDDDWQPYFSSKATGDVLLRVAQENLDVEFLVLCGHTHSEAYHQALSNLIVKAGRAEYYQPIVQEVIALS